MSLRIGQNPKQSASDAATGPKDVCKICLGVGKIWNPTGGNGSGAHRMCTCTFLRKLGKWLGPILSEAPDVDTDLGKLTSENVLLTGSWHELSGHVKQALSLAYYYSNLNYAFRLFTDEDLKYAYFNPTEKYDMDSGVRTKVVTNHKDLVDRRYDLVIIRLGVMSTKNSEMPSILQEVLKYREAEKRPTWLIASDEVPFKKGHRCWNEEVGAYVAENFIPVDTKGQE